MLADLFKPAWKNSSVEKRLKAVTGMDSLSSENQKILTQLSTDDEDDSIRIAAIQKLTSVKNLHELSLKHATEMMGKEAEKRLNDLIGSDGFINEKQCGELLNSFPALTARFAAHVDIASVRTEAIHKLSVNEQLEVLGVTEFTDSRQLIAEKLSDISALESARKILRGKDKNAERILKAKIDDFREQQRQLAENLTTVARLTEEVEYLGSHDWLPEFKARVPLHRKQWDNLDFDIEAGSKQRYQKARTILDARFDEQILIEQTQQSQQRLIEELEAFVKSIAKKDLVVLVESISETQTSLDQLHSNWQQLAVTYLPDRGASDRYDSMINALQSANRLVLQATEILREEKQPEVDEPELVKQVRVSKKLAEKSQLLKTALKKLKWPAVYGELQLATDIKSKLEEWQKIQTTTVAEKQQKLDSLHKKINSIFRFSRNGNLARAKQFCERVEKGLNQFTGKEHQVLEERFQEARKTLGKMDDWKNFATEPKYLELCEAMELLLTSKKHPDKISNDMKDLQQQWKSLGNSEISELYWPRFKLSADKVYQPCAEFFEKRHKTRQVHLEQRQQYVEEMRQLLDDTDWEHDPDYKSVQSAVRSISDHFTAIKEVEHKAGQKQWKQFSKLKDDVFAKLDVAYEANIELKQQLIKHATTLAETDAKDDNLAKLKILQTRWKQVGVTRRNQDQKAWKEFKKQGDIVYSNVQQLRQGKRAETDQQLNAYRDIIKAIQKLAKTAKDLAEADQQFSVLQNNYAELPELPTTLPEKLIEGIQRDYQKACDQFDTSHSRIINNKHQQQIESLRLKAKLCEQLEALGKSPSDEQLQDISSQWEAIELRDSVLSRRIQERRNSAQSAIDRTAVAAERRMMCIKLEIAKGIESPAEDKALRMQYQLDQMNKSGLGHQTINSREQLEDMELDWLCMPGAEAQLQNALDERFKRVLGQK